MYDRAAAVAFARAQVGKPYVFAASGPNAWDCSGLTMESVRRGGGPTLTHKAGAQATYFREAGRLFLADKTHLAQIQPGDVLFWYGAVAHPESFGHCGLFAGRSTGIRYVIQATDEQLGVQRIRMNQYGPPTAVGYVDHPFKS